MQLTKGMRVSIWLRRDYELWQNYGMTLSGDIIHISAHSILIEPDEDIKLKLGHTSLSRFVLNILWSEIKGIHSEKWGKDEIKEEIKEITKTISMITDTQVEIAGRLMKHMSEPHEPKKE